MTPIAIGICVACQCCLVIGHLLLKRGMNATHSIPPPWPAIVGYVAGGVALLSVWFFLWLGVLQSWDLSQVFPFEGLAPPFLAFCAWFFLGERVSAQTWLGIAIIGAGMALVVQP